MTSQELFSRERAAIVDARTEIFRTVEELFRKWNERLDDYEKRFVATILTGGVPSKSIDENGKLKEPVPATEIPLIEEKKESKKGKPDRE